MKPPINDIGILRDGVQIRSPLSDDIIYYGNLDSVQVLNGGKNYDVVNPPSISVETSQEQLHLFNLLLLEVLRKF